MSWLKKLASGLSKTSARVTSSLASLLGRPSIDAASLEDLEDALITADLGTAAAARLAAARALDAAATSRASDRAARVAPLHDERARRQRLNSS